MGFLLSFASNNVRVIVKLQVTDEIHEILGKITVYGQASIIEQPNNKNKEYDRFRTGINFCGV